MEPLQIGITSWSLARNDLFEALRVATEGLHLSGMQAGFFNDGIPDEGDDARIIEAVRRSGIELTGTCAGFAGEDYSTIAVIAATGGYAPDATFEERFAQTLRMRDLSSRLGVSLFTVHVGFVPEDPEEPKYRVMLERVGRVADALAAKSIVLAMETGQETAETMARFVGDLGRENVRINFDPGNMILYGVGEPVEALRHLGQHVAHVHVKDATWSASPGAQWGTEVMPGTGDADIPRVISKLRSGGYRGPLVIEREMGRAGGLGELRDTVRFLSSLL
jgi:sugar phosphate isomerase/epimerase